MKIINTVAALQQAVTEAKQQGLSVMFAVLKLFFFQPTLKGSAAEKANTVGDNFVQEQRK